MDPRVVLDLGKSGCRGHIEGTDRYWEWEGLPVGGAGGERAIDILTEGVLEGVARSGHARPASVLIGSNFIPRVDFGDAVARRLSEAHPGVGFLLLEDGLLAHAGALGGVGVVASVGTGTVVFGIDADGDVRRVDGWGPDLGDRGGAVDLGRRGLAAICAAIDGVGAGTELKGAAEAYLGRPFTIETVRWLLGAPRRVPTLAGFAKEVVNVAAQGDAVANELVDDAAGRLADSCAAAARGGDGPVAIVGRLGTMHYLAERLRRELLARGLTPVRARGRALDATWTEAVEGPYRRLARVWVGPAD